MTDVSRRFRFSYNGQQIGGTVSGTAELDLTGVHRVRVDALEFEVELRFVLTADTDADFSTGLQSVHDDLGAWHGDLRLDVLSEVDGTVDTTPLDLRPSAQTATNVQAELEKLDDERWQGVRTQLYRLRVTGGRVPPAARNGLRQDFSYDLEWDSSRILTATFRGTYTHVSGETSALAQYQAQIAAKVESVRSALGVQWELIGPERVEHPNDQDDEVRFERVYREVHFNQVSGVLNDPRIVDPSLSIEDDTPGTDGDEDGVPLRRLVATYESAVPKDQETDLRRLWLTVIRPYVIRNVIDAAGSAIGVEDSSVRFDPFRQVLVGRVVAVTSGGSSVVSRNVVVDDAAQSGAIVRYVWPNGGPPGDWQAGQGHVYWGSPVSRRTITTTTTFLGKVSPPSVGGGRAGGQIGAFGIFLGPNAIANAQAAIAGAAASANDLAAAVNVEDPFASERSRGASGAEAGGQGGGGGDTPIAVPIEKRRSTRQYVKGKAGERLDFTDVVAVEVVEFVLPVSGPGDGGDDDTTGTTRERSRG